MSKTTKLLLAVVLPGMFMVTSFNAVATPWDPVYEPPSGLRDRIEPQPLQWTHLQPLRDSELLGPRANPQEEHWAMPFQWGGDHYRALRPLPIIGASFWAGLDCGAVDCPGGAFDSFTFNFYRSAEGGIPTPANTPIYSAEVTDFRWTNEDPVEQWGDHAIYRIGASHPSGLFPAWNPADYGVVPGETLWFSPRANPSDEWDFGEDGDQIRWLAGTRDPDPGLDLRGVPRLGAFEGRAVHWTSTSDVAWRDGGHPLAFSVEVVPEPTTMTLLGIGLAGFATRRFVSRKKAE